MADLAVRVTDMNEWPEGPIEDRYEGVKYTFQTSRPVTIPLAAAKHFFGFDEVSRKADLVHTARRYGWNTKETAPRAKEWFGNLLIEPVIIREVEITPDVSEDDLQTALSLAKVREPAIPNVME